MPTFDNNIHIIILCRYTAHSSNVEWYSAQPHFIYHVLVILYRNGSVGISSVSVSIVSMTLCKDFRLPNADLMLCLKVFCAVFSFDRRIFVKIGTNWTSPYRHKSTTITLTTMINQYLGNIIINSLYLPIHVVI